MAGGLIRVYNGANGSLLRELKAFSDAFLGGVRVAGGEAQKTRSGLIALFEGSAAIHPQLSSLSCRTLTSLKRTTSPGSWFCRPM
jgi:hypothetical protein